MSSYFTPPLHTSMLANDTSCISHVLCVFFSPMYPLHTFRFLCSKGSLLHFVSTTHQPLNHHILGINFFYLFYRWHFFSNLGIIFCLVSRWKLFFFTLGYRTCGRFLASLIHIFLGRPFPHFFYWRYILGALSSTSLPEIHASLPLLTSDVK